MRWIVAGILSICLSPAGPLCFPGDAHAHKVSVFAYAEGGKVFVEAYFVDGKKAEDARVEVFNGKGVKILSGKTDEDGRWAFPIPAVAPLKIIIVASMGHRSSISLTEKEVRLGLATKGIKEVQGGYVGREEIEEMLDRKISPLYRMVSDLRKKMEKPTVGEVVGGVGYLVGLGGILLLFLGRKKNKGE